MKTPPTLSPSCVTMRRLKRSSTRAFTLIELMVVMSIMLLLMTLSVGVAHSWKAQKLTTEARLLSGQLSEVALLAQKDNFPVQVRFYLLPNEFGDTSSEAMRAVQLARLTGFDPNTRQPIYKFLSEVRFFEDDIILLNLKNYTSLCEKEPTPAGESDPEIKGEKRSYRSFHFLPNGSTDLPRTPDAVFTLVKENEMKSGNQPPPNYRSVMLQPVTGKATMY
ncbi:Verru_Chthon cassette protein D [Roseimicrobium sp. ORNL1]|uniref:Verru_Chthon cassette protein D n=1 Tax=Roseimicrobium sp. ORNL1 TaxID=2711231 RepID=UPI0013E188CF|nr:Verru_Chthon cassette protein D [Roseimicrobium sp. ORNL1]QIF01871.1 Verru_Chthon cassette protein D [Roseimicrobium sp. ORNL1]